MKLPWMIKCNCTGPRYLYWSGVDWTSKIEFAAHFATKAEAQDEIKSLSNPRIIDMKSRGVEAFTLDLAHANDE